MPRKTIVNHAPHTVSMNLYVREGYAPGRVRASIPLRLGPGASATVEYGDPHNPLLEGIELTWIENGARLTHRKLVAQLNTPWDDALNRSNGLLIRGTMDIDAAPMRVSAESAGLTDLGALQLAG